MSVVYVGAVAPEYLAIDVATVDGFDLSTVTSAVLMVRCPGPSFAVRTWACVLSGQSATGLTATHVYEEGDIETDGTYRIYVSMTTPSGVIRSLPRTFTARHLLT